MRLCVLVSGSGTILEAMLEDGLDVILVDRNEFGGFGPGFDRDAYSTALAATLGERSVDLVAMAGFGTILTGSFHAAFPGRVLNTHPSLLPDFKGWHAVAQAIEAGVAQSGCTVHVATEALDDGPILAQQRVDVLDTDDEASLHERIKSVERVLYPDVVRRVMVAMGDGLEPVAVRAVVKE